jgi:phosphohistidine phosphatase SixA
MEGFAGKRVRRCGLAAVLALAAALLLAACGGAEGGPATPTETATATVERRPLPPDQLVEELRGGGYVLYFRHALTDHSVKEPVEFDLTDCSAQRNLTPEGREQARQIGAAIRRLGIPLGAILSSEYCRALETARLAFERVHPVPDLTGLAGVFDPEERAAQIEALRRMLARRPADGLNTILVAHVRNLEEAVGISLAEGEVAIFEPLDDDRFRLVGRLPANVWPQLADA